MTEIDFYTKDEVDGRIWTGTYSDYAAMDSHSTYALYVTLDSGKVRIFLGDVELTCGCNSEVT